MDKITIGVDPGTMGGFTILNANIGACYVFPMPLVGKEMDLEWINETCTLFREDVGWRAWHAWLEDAQAMRRPLRGAEACPACGSLPGTQGVVSTGTFMRGAGLVEGCLRGMGIECTRIKAREWQTIMLGRNRPRGRVPLKLASIKKARELFPNVNFKRTPRCTTYSDGMADSALIAAYGSRMQVVG